MDQKDYMKCGPHFQWYQLKMQNYNITYDMTTNKKVNSLVISFKKLKIINKGYLYISNSFLQISGIIGLKNCY